MSENQTLPKNGMLPIHPGEFLKEEFMDELGLTIDQIAEALEISYTCVTDILEGKQPITANLAPRLSIALGTSPNLWMNLQTAFDLRTEELLLGNSLKETVKVLNKV